MLKGRSLALVLVLLSLIPSALVLLTPEWLGRREAARWPTLAETPPISVPAAVMPPSEGAWTALEAAGELQALDREPTVHKELDDFLGPPPRAVRESWSLDSEAIDAVEAALAEFPGRFSGPRQSDPTDPFPDFGALVRVASSLMLRGWSQAEEGDAWAGVSDMLTSLELGRRFIDGEGTLIQGMVGVSIQDRATRELGELLDYSVREDLPSLELALDGLGQLEGSPRSLPRFVAEECRHMERLVQQSLEDPSLFKGRRDGYLDTLWGGLLKRWLLDEDLTLVWYRVHCAREVEAASQPWITRPPLLLDDHWPPSGQRGLV
ncbi:MAG: hypothetical protein VX498_00170, partial [Myxococcota bacterium]|nr:hypothetical protein [Myxococcota bacterium]